MYVYLVLLKDHLRKCEYEKVPCGNNCGIHLQRWALVKHMKEKCTLRKVNCCHCVAVLEQRQMEVIQFNKQNCILILCLYFVVLL